MMGKGRKPCCDKAVVKKGPWSEAEDLKLISFIQNHGHSNWRALPKLAGLARCGKSCRLRWVNYLRPDLKRGNFTFHEEETIIKLHEVLGNKWSTIASHFPGRTDNEIKNVWNTHLKKRIVKIKQPSNASTTNPCLDKILDESNKDCSEQVLIHQTSLIEETIEQSSSSSTSYSSQTSFNSDHQMSDIDPAGLNQIATNYNSNVIKNLCDNDVIGTGEGEIKGNLSEELIEIPFEPNLDLWDLLDEESNSADSEVRFNDVDEAPLNPISENDNKNYNKEVDGSWWWLVYLENELGLDHNESTLL